jgi:hypothetical protein
MLVMYGLSAAGMVPVDVVFPMKRAVTRITSDLR